MTQIGLLSTANSPFLLPTIAELHKAKLFDLTLFLDEKQDSEKNLGIWRERTGGFFENRADIPPSLYALQTNPPRVYFVSSHNSAVLADLTSKLQIGVLLNAGTPRKLSGETLDAIPHGIINVHPGILPKYRGTCCVEWAIYNDDQVGCTAHFMTEEYDEGPIISVEAYEFPKDADYRLIRCMTYQNGFELMAKAASKVIQTGIQAKELPAQELGQYWKPIPAEKMDEVLLKIKEHRYKYLTLDT